MPLRATCPSCDRSYTVGDALADKSLRCKECGEVFQVAPSNPAKQAKSTKRPKPASGETVRSGPQKVVRRRADENDEDHDDENDDLHRKKKRRKKKKVDRTPLIVGAAVAGSVMVVIAITFAIVAARPSGPAPAPAPAVAEKPAAAKENGIPLRTAPIDDAQKPADPIAAKPAADDEVPADFYGKLEGEPAGFDDPAKSIAERRPRADDTLIRLSNIRIDSPKIPGGRTTIRGKAILIDFEVLHRGKFDGASLTINKGKGLRSQFVDKTPVYEDRGTLEFVLGTTQTPTKAEVYLTRTDSRFDPPITVKVSNSVILGTIEIGTRVRNWTNSEYAAYRKGPPNYSNPNAHSKIGKDTAWAGSRSRADGIAERFVEPDGHLLGFEVHPGVLQNEKVVRFLKPILARNQPVSREEAHMAKEGYAVSGLEVRADKGQVNAVKIHFRKLKPDGSLDSEDAYASDWIGPAPEAGKGILLGNTGVPVIGANIDRTVACINGVALVMAK